MTLTGCRGFLETLSTSTLELFLPLPSFAKGPLTGVMPLQVLPPTTEA